MAISNLQYFLKIIYDTFALLRDMKLNKGTILKASCDFIRQLQKGSKILTLKYMDQ